MRSLLLWLLSATLVLADSTTQAVDSLLAKAGPANPGVSGGGTAKLGPTTSLGGNMSIFSELNDRTGTYTRNPAIWTASLALTGISCLKKDGQGTFASCITLITPTDAVSANHTFVGPANAGGVGTAYYFVDSHNKTHTAMITALANITGTDIEIIHLAWEGDTPRLKTYKVLPPNYRQYLTSTDFTAFPCVLTNQFRQMFVHDSNQPPFGGGFFIHRPATSGLRAPYSPTIVVGDSGCPVFLVNNDELVLIGATYSVMNVPMLADHIPEIDTALRGFSDDPYQLTIARLNAR